jgi:hypothetical protein
VLFFVEKVLEVISQEAGGRLKNLGIEVIALIFAKSKKLFGDLHGWIRNRLRPMQLKKWGNPRKFQRL